MLRGVPPAVINRIEVRVDVAQTRLDAIESPYDPLEVGRNYLAVEAGERSQREGLRGHQRTPEACPVRIQRVSGASDMAGSYREPGQGRFWALHRLRSGKALKATDLAREFEVAVRTAYRDLEWLRDEWRVPGVRPTSSTSAGTGTRAPGLPRSSPDRGHLEIPGAVRDERGGAGPDPHLPGEPIGRLSHTAQPRRVHAPQVMEGAERDSVLERVRALRGAEADMVVVQVLHRRAARRGATPSVAVEHPMTRGDLRVEGAPTGKGVVQHRTECLALCRESPHVPLHPAAYRAENRPKELDDVGGPDEAHRAGLF